MRRGTAIFGATVILLLASGDGAAAQTAGQWGWWTTSPLPVAPDAPADGLVVQGGPDAANPVAFAAVSYTLATGTTPTSLKLTVAPGSGTTPAATLAVCPLTGTFSPASGGAASAAPKYDCANKQTAAPAGDGASYTFDVAALAQNDTLAVAVVPTTATDRVVFQAPDPSALTTSTSTSGPSSSSTEVVSDGSTVTDPGTTGAATEFAPTDSGVSALPAPSSSGSFDTSGSALPEVSAPIATDGAVPATASAAPPAAAPPSDASSDGTASTFETASATSPSGGGGGRPVRALLFVALAVAAAALWTVAGSSARLAPAVATDAG